MTVPLYFTIFWIIGVLWTVYYWCSENSRINGRKVVFDVNSDKKGSIMSIDSSDASENEESTKCNRKRLKYETKTRWPSRMSVNAM